MNSAAANLSLVGLAVAVAVLSFSLAAKLASPANGDWPLSGWPGKLISRQTATGAEIAVLITVLLPLPALPRQITVAGLFTIYAAASLLLRGRDCGCFGSRLATRFTAWHTAGCATVVFLILVGNIIAPTAPGIWPVTITAAVGVVSGAVVYATPWGRHSAHGPVALPNRPDLIDHIVVYGRNSCPFCAILWDQQDYYRSFAGVPLEFRTATDEDTAIAKGGVPAAAGYDGQGRLVSGPVRGLDEIRDLVRSTLAPGLSGQLP